MHEVVSSATKRFHETTFCCHAFSRAVSTAKIRREIWHGFAKCASRLGSGVAKKRIGEHSRWKFTVFMIASGDRIRILYAARFIFRLDITRRRTRRGREGIRWSESDEANRKRVIPWRGSTRLPIAARLQHLTHFSERWNLIPASRCPHETNIAVVVT